MDIGSAVGRKNGLTERQIVELAQFESSDVFDPLDRLVLRLATLMAQTHVEVPASLIVELQNHLNQKQLVELVSTIAWENNRARFNRAFDIHAAGFSEGAVCALPVGSTRSAEREA